MAIHGITLDAAGTIIQVKEPVSKTYSEIANRHGIPIDAAAIEQAFRTVFPRMSPLAFGTSEGTELNAKNASGGARWCAIALDVSASIRASIDSSTRFTGIMLKPTHGMSMKTSTRC